MSTEIVFMIYRGTSVNHKDDQSPGPKEHQFNILHLCNYLWKKELSKHEHESLNINKLYKYNAYVFEARPTFPPPTRIYTSRILALFINI
jgi:hypothetical protein